MAEAGLTTNTGTNIDGQSKSSPSVAEQTSKSNVDHSDDELDSIDEKSTVLKAYHSLLSRRVDLVGDYAGDELFLVEGDSILRRCFEDVKLDMTTGCQLLHAIYTVERFLFQLVKRKCNFNIVFFDCNESLCIPTSVPERFSARYLLARAVIIHHLRCNVTKSHPTLETHTFSAWDSPDFINHLQTSSPYFVMAHDGAAPAQLSSEAARVTPSTNETHRLALRKMILSFVARGFNMALVNGLEWRDTKLMTMVLEPGRISRKAVEGIQIHADQNQLRSGSHANSAADLGKLRDCNLSPRQLLSVVSVSDLLQTDALSPTFAATFLLHTALLSHMPLSARRLALQSPPEKSQAALDVIITSATAIIGSAEWRTAIDTCPAPDDMVDLLDGRLFHAIAQDPPAISAEVRTTFDKLLSAVELASAQSRRDLTVPTSSADVPSNAVTAKKPASIAVLPFSNPVFDAHMESVKLKLDSSIERPRSLAARKVFQEVTHWHNYKKPIVTRATTPAQDQAEAKRKFFADRRNQWFMAEMRTYAASLTNAVGKSLEPETIITGVSRQSTLAKSETPSPADSEASDSATSTKSKSGKKAGGGKNAAKSAGKQAMMNQLAANKAKRDESANSKIFSAWQAVCKGFEADSDPRSRYRRAKEYLTSLQTSWRTVIGTEVELYMLNCLLHYWIETCRKKAPERHVAALIWSHARSIASQSPLTKSMIDRLELTRSTLQIPSLPPMTQTPSDRALSFSFALPSVIGSLNVGLSSKEFQLLEGGPYLERSFDSKPDPRVEFQPDGWQRKVLDTIDQDKSAFVVAPTSAGKTFISFYAMRKVLEADEESVLVYVAPTKALVNQIAAEIQARYSKRFKYGGKSVWAIHTRDYRINNPTGCQVLVTVPHVLQIMLLAPSHANTWSSRVRRIIFDEVHSIGQAEDGVVWEQLLLMAPCPIIALSATVGNPQEFSDWLGSTQQAIGKELVTIQHPHRYSDLRKYYYVPPSSFEFQGLPEKTGFAILGLEGLTGFNYVHPVAGLVNKTRGIPEDLALEPRDCFLLWQSMRKLQTDEYPVSARLDPANALPEVARKADILAWEKNLKDLLRKWIADPESPYERVLKSLEGEFPSTKREQVYRTLPSAETVQAIPVDEDNLKSTTLPLLCRLHEQDALPAILFNLDRHECETICQTLFEQLKSAEETGVKSGPKWAKTLERFEEYKKVKEKASAKKASAKKAKPQADGEELSKLDAQKDAADDGVSKWEAFDPEAPVEGYHFANHAALQTSEFEAYVHQLRRRDISTWLIDALGRGIGIHHAGMNRKYRQTVEILFRKRFLRVIIATGTLALGINMPCKTVVFSGDSVFLTALNYRQCAGRAGRRGFDLLGNVVFQGVSRQKVCRLLSSRLPDLNGHFPITTTLVLRLFTLLHESKGAKYAINAINSLLSQPRLYLGGPSFKAQTMHHLRFSIEYLRRQHLLGSDGAPLNFAGLVSHLYFTENSAFAFHALLKEGFFHQLCADVGTDEKGTLETLMLVMAHLFGRIQCRQADKEYARDIVKPSSSVVFLPPLPEAAARILSEHNRQTLGVYKSYVQTFVDQHLEHDETTLPLSGLKAGSDSSGSRLKSSLEPTRIRSAFIGLSGNGDDFETIGDLCASTRDGVFLEEAVVPRIELYPQESSSPMNAYLLDFFKHGDVATIERANRVRRSEIWFLLNDFSLVLATIITSLMNFMKLTDVSDVDFLEVRGDMDAHEEAEDDKVAAAESGSEGGSVSNVSIADSGVVIADRTAAVKTKAAVDRKAKKADSWEDLASDDSDDDTIPADVAATTSKTLADQSPKEDDPAWAADRGEGLKDVLKAFQKLHAEFNIKFRAMWA